MQDAADPEDLPKASNTGLAILFAVISIPAVGYLALAPWIRFDSPNPGDFSLVPRSTTMLEPERTLLGEDFTVDRSILIAQKALKQKWSIQAPVENNAWPDVSLPLNSLWPGSAVKDRTWQYRLHSLYVLHHLVIAHRNTQDPRFLETGKQVLVSWIENNPLDDPPCEFSWNDHAAANRAIAIAAFVDYCEPLGILDDRFKSMIADSLAQHAAFLANPIHYAFPHNHGIFQDQALIVSATHLQNSEATKRWICIATRRLIQQIRRTYSREGVHLENSPGYHVTVTHLLKRILGYMESTGLQTPAEIQKTLAQAERIMPLFIMPNGHVVPVGDTGRESNRGIAPNPSSPDLHVFPEAGYGIVNGPLYVFFTAANNTVVHKHRDDLSFIVADEWGPVLTDVGFLGYVYENPECVFSESWTAHNVVTPAAEGKGRVSSRCGIESYGKNGDAMYLRGRSIRRNGSVHVRSILYDWRDHVLLVVDDCESAQKESWQRFFHFEPDIEVEQQPDGQSLIRRGDGSPWTLVSWPPTLDRQTVIAGKEPLQGWVAEPHRHLIPAPTIVETLSGTKLQMAAVFMPRPGEVRLELTTKNEINVETSEFKKTIRILPDTIRIDTSAKGESATAKTTKTSSIPLQSHSLKKPYKPKKVLRWQYAVVLLLLNTIGWIAAIGITRKRSFRRGPMGFALVCGCAVVNLIALSIALPLLQLPEGFLPCR